MGGASPSLAGEGNSLALERGMNLLIKSFVLDDLARLIRKMIEDHSI
jgi:hypothetical protein